MKILYIGTFGKHCSDPYRLKGFDQAGIKYSVVDFRKIFKKGGASNLVNYITHILDTFIPDLVFVNKGEKFTRDMIIELKKKSGGAKWWLFYGDQRNEIEGYLKSVFSCYDAILVNSDDDDYNNKLVKCGAKKIIYHHSATDIDVFRKLKISEQYDIAFFGGNYNDSFPDSKFRKRLVVDLYSKYHVLIHGTNWGGIGKPLVYGNDYAKQATRSRILLGVNAFSNINKYCSNRLFNSMACGFHITHYFKGIENMFENHHHLVWFKSYKELVGIIDYYLQHPEERKRIHFCGRSLIEKYHTYHTRAKEIINHWRQYEDSSF